MRLTSLTLLAAGLLLIFAGAALPQTDPQDTSGAHGAKGSAERLKNGTVGSVDRAWMMKAAEGGMAEVELGRVATNNGSNQAVKDFGQHMVDDHSKANDELKALASGKGVDLPASLNAKDEAEKTRLSNLTGDAFDRAYIRAMVSDHKKDIAEFQHEANHGRDPDVKAWAAKTLPTLKQHLQMALDAESKLGGANK